jgi:hypothetical protein
MAKVEIVRSLFEEIEKTFKKDSDKIFDLIETVENNHSKGKTVGNVAAIVIKELKYKGYRFYFIVDGYTLKFVDTKELQDLLLRFVRMSDKKRQKKTIESIKDILRNIGPTGFE